MNVEIGEDEDNKMDLHLVFHISTYFSKHEGQTKSMEILDPILHFKFSYYKEPALNRWINEHLPLVPIPGGIAINILAVKSIIENWNKLSPEMRREQLLRSYSKKLYWEADNLNKSAKGAN